MPNSYYATWTKQENACLFPISGTAHDYFITPENNHIYDLSSTSFHTAFGFSYRPIINSLKNQIDDFTIAGPKTTFDLKEKASLKLLNYLKLREGKIFYTLSGAEAIENALKMARQTSGKEIILARKKSYHGATLGALSITGDWRNKEHLTLDKSTVRIPEPNDDPNCIQTEKIINDVGADKIAAFCLETITGGNGVIIPRQQWWDRISELCIKYNIYLILDEVVCGFGRTGKNFGFHHFNLKPDFVCMAKVITGGYIPFGAVYTSKDIANYYNKNTLSCGLTNYAQPLGLTVMSKVIETLETQEFIHHKERLEKSFNTILEHNKNSKNVKEIRSFGLLACIEIAVDISVPELLKEGIYCSIIGKNIILAPPYIMEIMTLEDSLNKLFTILNGK
jgi:taurine--2-oxoglutarate transaminase